MQSWTGEMVQPVKAGLTAKKVDTVLGFEWTPECLAVHAYRRMAT